MVTWEYDGPAGKMVVGACGAKIVLCDWANARAFEANKARAAANPRAAKPSRRNDAAAARVIAKFAKQLDEYFAGKRKVMKVRTLMAGTEFQQMVWRELSKIPYGQMVSYAEVARRLGLPTSVRAVANAIAANPISIVVPCHRVIGSSGCLTGYAGGLDAKRILLRLENRDIDAQGLFNFKETK